LTDSSGSVSDTYVYDAYGTLLSSSGVTTNSYLYTGEQYDKNLGEYYLRARYYSPSEGRFTGRDPFEGMLSEPLSLNKYAYVHGNPINATDPTGMMTMLDVSASLQLASIVAGYFVAYNAINPLRSSAGTAGNLGGSNTGNNNGNLSFQVKLLLSLYIIKTIINTQDPDGEAGIPLVFYGDTALDGVFKSITKTSEHVGNSIFSGKPFVLAAARRGPTWYNLKPECNTEAKREYGRLHNTPGNRKKTSCDEYPFNSTEQGGESNYPLGVSLKLVPKEEATPQGSLMNIGIKPRLGIVIGDEEKKWYGVVPLFSLSTTSFWRNTNGDIIF
jgi:RHS repeat-associated protein